MFVGLPKVQPVPGHWSQDKWIVTIDYSLSPVGDVLPPRIIFEGLMPPDAQSYAAKGWQLCHSANCWSTTSLAAQDINNVESHFEKVL